MEFSKQEMITKYDYDGNGRQSRQSGRGTTFSNDGFENYTAGTIEQTYEPVPPLTVEAPRQFKI